MAVICAGAYLPPKVFSTAYHFVTDSATTANWGDAANWSPSGVPTAASDSAIFDVDFTASRTVSLNVNSAIGVLKLSDPVPPTTLTIAATATSTFQMPTATMDVNGVVTGGLTVNVGSNETLNINASSTSTAALTGGSLVKAGLGTLALSGANTYTGATYITSGLLQVTALADGGLSSNIGQSTGAAANLVLNGGTLQYKGSGSSTNRLYTIGADANGIPSATIDGSGTGALVLSNTGAAAFAGTGDRTLVLRGTFGGSGASALNELDTLLKDPSGNVLNLTKNDAGSWRVTNSNTYTGLTTVQRGLLQLDYTRGPQTDNFDYTAQPGTAQPQSPQSRIPDGSTVYLGGLPGGGNLELYGGAPRRSQGKAATITRSGLPDSS